MPVGLLLDIEGMDTRMYDELNAAAKFPAEVPEGLISHIAGPTESGMRVLDIWESREYFDRFVDDRLGPALGSIDAHPIELSMPEVFEIHDEFHR